MISIQYGRSRVSLRLSPTREIPDSWMKLSRPSLCSAVQVGWCLPWQLRWLAVHQVFVIGSGWAKDKQRPPHSVCICQTSATSSWVFNSFSGSAVWPLTYTNQHCRRQDRDKVVSDRFAISITKIYSSTVKSTTSRHSCRLKAPRVMINPHSHSLKSCLNCPLGIPGFTLASSCSNNSPSCFAFPCRPLSPLRRGILVFPGTSLDADDAPLSQISNNGEGSRWVKQSHRLMGLKPYSSEHTSSSKVAAAWDAHALVRSAFLKGAQCEAVLAPRFLIKFKTLSRW